MNATETKATAFSTFVLAVKMAFYKKQTPEHVKRFMDVNESMGAAVNEHAALNAVAEAAQDVLEQFDKSVIRVGPDLADSLRVFLKPALANLATIRKEGGK